MVSINFFSKIVNDLFSTPKSNDSLAINKNIIYEYYFMHRLTLTYACNPISNHHLRTSFKYTDHPASRKEKKESRGLARNFAWTSGELIPRPFFPGATQRPLGPADAHRYLLAIFPRLAQIFLQRTRRPKKKPQGEHRDRPTSKLGFAGRARKVPGSRETWLCGWPHVFGMVRAEGARGTGAGLPQGSLSFSSFCWLRAFLGEICAREIRRGLWHCNLLREKRYGFFLIIRNVVSLFWGGRKSVLWFLF